jgi:hypothetical protein
MTTERREGVLQRNFLPLPASKAIRFVTLTTKGPCFCLLGYLIPPSRGKVKYLKGFSFIPRGIDEI